MGSRLQQLPPHRHGPASFKVLRLQSADNDSTPRKPSTRLTCVLAELTRKLPRKVFRTPMVIVTLWNAFKCSGRGAQSAPCAFLMPVYGQLTPLTFVVHRMDEVS